MSKCNCLCHWKEGEYKGFFHYYGCSHCRVKSSPTDNTPFGIMRDDNRTERKKTIQEIREKVEHMPTNGLAPYITKEDVFTLLSQLEGRV